MFGLRSPGRAQLRWEHVMKSGLSNQEPPRSTLYMPLAGPGGFRSGASA